MAARHGIRPRKSLGQHFLADANLARAIAREAGAAPGTRFLEVGAGLGSLTVALAEAGAEVLAVEVDPRLTAALTELVDDLDAVEVLRADATSLDWGSVLDTAPRRMASNLPYNVAVPVLLDLLDRAPTVDPLVVMVQREVGERLAAAPSTPAYGAVTLRVAYRARARVVRRVPPSVFWPEPQVESVLVRVERHPPPVDAPEEALFRLIGEGFGQRRKTLAGALVRLGLERGRAREIVAQAGLDAAVRAEALGLEELAAVLAAAAELGGGRRSPRG
ncbi:MAG TPA: 16S rRNA (adenine(1518)-N(6)/adenine(1519)-N(6))-dimethyltransferase RsmA [Actinomycetota bacterium]|nr:16S rRNA (adenine(1518)-N(6)/adenine(1519)-N(6))-dimethyltransferase RsmA [Actinomycetota bacterium]